MPLFSPREGGTTGTRSSQCKGFSLRLLLSPRFRNFFGRVLLLLILLHASFYALNNSGGRRKGGRRWVEGSAGVGAKDGKAIVKNEQNYLVGDEKEGERRAKLIEKLDDKTVEFGSNFLKNKISRLRKVEMGSNDAHDLSNIYLQKESKSRAIIQILKGNAAKTGVKHEGSEADAVNENFEKYDHGEGAGERKKIVQLENEGDGLDEDYGKAKANNDEQGGEGEAKDRERGAIKYGERDVKVEADRQRNSARSNVQEIPKSENEIEDKEYTVENPRATDEEASNSLKNSDEEVPPLDDSDEPLEADSEEHDKSFVPFYVSTSNWTTPLSSPPGGMTCESYLEESDKIQYERDFDQRPVMLVGFEDRPECAVRCVSSLHVDLSQADAGLGILRDGGKDSSGTFGVLRSMEPRSYYPSNDPKLAKSQGFGIVMTVHLDSDVPVQYGSWEEYDIMRAVNFEAKRRPKKEEEEEERGRGENMPALAAAFISNCNAHNFRLEAISDFQRYFPVHSYGGCANNIRDGGSKVELLSHYLYSFAFENSCEEDYVTEKYWQSLVAGTVPIVVGAPNIRDFEPQDGYIIHVKSVEEIPAAAHLALSLSHNFTLWRERLQWKEGKSLNDKFLAFLDLSTVHSTCRLCLWIADAGRRREEEKMKREGRLNRVCRCKPFPHSPSPSTRYHIFVRERGRFDFHSIFLEESQLSLPNLLSAIRTKFRSLDPPFRPVWFGKRPQMLSTPEIVNALRIYRVYPSGSTVKDSLYGEAWFRTDRDFQKYLAQNPCPHLDVIFV